MISKLQTKQENPLQHIEKHSVLKTKTKWVYRYLILHNNCPQIKEQVMGKDNQNQEEYGQQNKP